MRRTLVKICGVSDCATAEVAAAAGADLAEHIDVLATLQLALLQDDVVEGTAGDLIDDQIGGQFRFGIALPGTIAAPTEPGQNG